MKPLPDGWEYVPRGWLKRFPPDAEGRFAWAIITNQRARRWTYLCRYYSAIGSKQAYPLVEDAIADVEQKHAEIEAARKEVTG